MELVYIMYKAAHTDMASYFIKSGLLAMVALLASNSCAEYSPTVLLLASMNTLVRFYAAGALTFHTLLYLNECF
jgi:hypothetical protein